MTVARADTVTARVAPANHDHVLAVCAQLLFERVARIDLVLLGQELHGKVNTVQLAPWDGQVSGLLRARAHEHRIEVFLKLLGADVLLGPIGHFGIFGPCAHQHASFKDHAFGLHLLDAAIDVRFLHLEVWDAIAQQAAHSVVLFKHRHRMTHAGQLLGRGQPRGA